MSEKRAVPVWVVVVGVAMIVGGAATCREQIGEAISDSSMWTRADGKPLDYAGDRLKCPLCADDGEQGVIVWQSGYLYRCERCGRDMEARMDDERTKIEFAF